MKEPEKLIRQYYADHGITHGAPLLFSYVRKSTTGGDGAVVEYYAAKYGHVRGKKGKDIVTKCVMRFNPDTYRYAMSDSVIRYEPWSTLSMSHLIFDFHREMTGCIDYGWRCGAETGGNALRSYGNWKREIMPTSEIPLNDFDGTKYQYCKYRYKDASISATSGHSYRYWAHNPYGSLPDYLRLFSVNPHAMELFASKGLVHLMKRDFLVRLRDDKPFARWYRKHAIQMMHESVYRIENAARREIGKTCWEIVRNETRRLARISRRRKLRREERAEIRRKEEIKRKQANEKKMRAMRIKNLYTRLKSICQTYGAYEVVVPKSEREMMAEGERMHNCVGRVYPSMHGIDCIIVFLHKNGKPCVDIEVDAKTFAVKQCRAVCNQDADDTAHKLATEVAEQIKNIYRKAA